MNVITRRKLEMASRVRDFNRTHPDTNAGYNTAVARLEERLTRADALAQQERAGHVTVKASVTTNRGLARSIREDLLVLQRVAGAASQEQPDLSVRVKLPAKNSNRQTFVTTARVAVTQSLAKQDLLVKYGLPDTFLTELGQALDQYEQAVNQKHDAVTAHVGASADLDAVADEMMLLVRQMDGINRLRFRKDAELLAAWNSARDIAWPAHEPASPDIGDTPLSTDVAPAA